jgi:hypothetical protein
VRIHQELSSYLLNPVRLAERLEHADKDTRHKRVM